MAAIAIQLGRALVRSGQSTGVHAAPGELPLLVGALLPADKKLRGSAYWAAWASILGSFILLLPTFVQSFTDENDTLYLLILIAEAVVVVAVGLGTRARALLLSARDSSASQRFAAR